MSMNTTRRPSHRAEKQQRAAPPARVNPYPLVLGEVVRTVAAPPLIVDRCEVRRVGSSCGRLWCCSCRVFVWVTCFSFTGEPSLRKPSRRPSPALGSSRVPQCPPPPPPPPPPPGLTLTLIGSTRRVTVRVNPDPNRNRNLKG